MTTNNLNINFDNLDLKKALADYNEWIRKHTREATNDIYKVSVGKIESKDGSHGFDLNKGSFWHAVEPEVDDKTDQEETQFETEYGCQYSIFSEGEDAYHIEIDPDYIWNKDDVWELINKLLYTIGEIDEDGELIGEEPEKQLFIISAPGPISEKTIEIIEENAKEGLKKANIDAVPLILSDGLKAYFEKPRP